jgi:16S rRNA (cytidine1402-2'-O)-methyltransferase
MTLFLIATPIGNLQDLSERALATLRSVDCILCEDTRVSLKLLRRFDIQKPLLPFHKFNEHEQAQAILQRLQQGQNIALISDAGTPALCDPGQNLVQKARLEGYTVTPIPGPCSVICALVASGLPTHPFTFCGFLDKHKKSRGEQLKKALEKPATQIFFESPERIASTLEDLQSLEPSRRLALAKEISKIHETFFLGSAEQAVTWLSQHSHKGEWILMIEGRVLDKASLWEDPEIENAMKHLRNLIEKGLSTRDAITAVSEISGLKSQILYKTLES